MTADKASATAIANWTGEAVNHLHKARVALKLALACAEMDYDNNADALRNIIGGLRLVESGVSHEYRTWTDYARHR